METAVFREAFEPNKALVAAVLALAKANIPPDVQELLLYGNPDRGVAPRALQAAIVAAVRELNQQR